MKIYAVGDIHGCWSILNDFINKKKPDIILQCGDFGWWPHFHKTMNYYDKSRYREDEWAKLKPFDNFGIKNKDTKIYWCPGNHENWNDLDKYGYDIFETQPNVFYMPFGSHITLPDGRVVLFCGGAASTDRVWRTPDYTWWFNEVISQKDMDNLPDIKVDIVISHTCPESWKLVFGKYYDLDNDSSSKALDIVLERYRPKEWYHGHFHVREKDSFRGCKWNALTECYGTG